MSSELIKLGENSTRVPRGLHISKEQYDGIKRVLSESNSNNDAATVSVPMWRDMSEIYILMQILLIIFNSMKFVRF